jgi:hypothetical protein
MADVIIEGIKTAIQVGNSVNAFVGIPLLGEALLVVGNIIAAVECADHNKNTCVRLRDRVLIAHDTLSHMQKKELEDNLAVKPYVEVLKAIEEFIGRISQASKFMRFLNSTLVSCHTVSCTRLRLICPTTGSQSPDTTFPSDHS